MNVINKTIEAVKSIFRTSTPYIYDINSNGVPSFWSLDIGVNKFQRQSYRDYLELGYGTNPYVYTVVSRIAETVPHLPFKFVDVVTGEKIEPNNEILSFLELIENSGGYHEFIEMSSTYLNTTGNLFYHKKTFLGNISETPDKLEIIHVPNVEINTINGRVWGMPISYSITDYGTGYTTVTAQDMIHCKYCNAVEQTNWGLSPLFSGQVVYDASNNEFFAESSLHRNMGADGIISRENGTGSIPLTSKEQTKIQNTFNQKSAGAFNFGKLMTTNAALKYIPLRFDSSKLKTLELNNKNLRIVAALYKLDAKIFGDPQASAFNNYSEANVSAFENCYVPHANFIFACLVKNILRDIFDVRGVKMVVDKERIPILNQRDLKYEEALRQQVRDGILTVNEFRAIVHPELGDINDTTNGGNQD